MSEEVRYRIDELSRLEYMLILNALKIWRGDFDKEPDRRTQIWGGELEKLLTKLGYPETGWPKGSKQP